MTADINYNRDAEAAIHAAQTDYVFLGKSVEEIIDLYKVPKELLAELIFTGKHNWRTLRAKVEEDELDRLINTSLFSFIDGIKHTLAKVKDFLSDDTVISDLDQVEKVMKVTAGMIKAAEVAVKLQEARHPKKQKALAEQARIPLLESVEEDDDEEDEYSKPETKAETKAKEDCVVQDLLDKLV